MIIDERTIADGISVSLLAKLITRHENKCEKYVRLMKYYRGEHEILNRRRESEGLANNRIVCNHAKYITDMSTAYLIGNPVTYAASEGYDIEALKNAYLEQDMSRIDREIVKNASIYGRAYELIYADGESKPKSACINPHHAFVVYNDDCTHVSLFGVYYYKTFDIDGNITGVVCNVYDDNTVYTYEGTSDDWNGMELTAQVPHYFGGVPIIEYRNNDEKQGDYEQIIPLMDAYNVLQSDRVNDKEQFVDAFLFLTGVDIDSEQAQKLKREKILMGYEGSTAEYLSKSMTESDVKVLRDDLKEDIHRLSMVPDLSDDNFGNNLSGVAIKYKLMGFEQHIKNKEGYIAEGFKTRFERYNSFLAIKGQMQIVPIHRVDVVFTHNLPSNNLETAQMINYLSGTVTNETLINQLDFVSDAREETENARKEALEASAEDYRMRIERTKDLAGGGGY